MKVTLDRIIRDCLALRGESPGLLPVLQEGEDSAVLTLAAEIKARLPAAAVEATYTTPPALLGKLPLHAEPPVIEEGTLTIEEGAYQRLLQVLVLS